MKTLTLHLIGNAHLDPVWLWDWREGMNEGLITCRTILNLMDEFEELTFVRGEAAIYQYIEEHDPKTFRRIAKQIEAGRWDVVGGTMIQPDTNLPAVETFARHFARGQQYFRSRFGKTVRVAWAADSFGHCAGLPEVMVAAGISGFAFTRPTADVLPLEKQAFWWEGPGGVRVLAYRLPVGWYGTDREGILNRLDESLAAASECDLENVGVFYGMGDHGGGPCRRQLREIRQWASIHPEVVVVHSGLHRLLDALRAEGKDLPTHRGEMNFTLRGCYSSAARFKFAYRKTEAAVASAERTESLIRAALRQPVAAMDAAWDAVLFNSFHDILPGTSIERAYEDQLAWLGGSRHQAQCTELSALNALAQRVDTRVAKPAGDYPAANALLAWNPHPWPFRGHLEWEANLDYRNLSDYKGRPEAVPVRVRDPAGRDLPFQSVRVENDYESPEWFWRRRVVVPVELPAFGWSVFEFGWVENGASPPASSGTEIVAAPGAIDNGIYRIEARYGEAGVDIFRYGQKVLGGDGLGAIVVEDQSGAWGSDQEDSRSLSKVVERWRVTQVEAIERGPERAALWVQLAGERSRIDLTFQLYRERDAVDVAARVLWNERQVRLKLSMPLEANEAEYDVPGARLRRPACGEVPGGRWVRVFGKSGAFGFASDALYGFDLFAGEFRATVTRSAGYTHNSACPLPPWRPTMDAGELKFRFLLNPGNDALPALAQCLEQPPVSIVAPATAGRWPRSGSLAALTPVTLQLLALKKAEDGRGLVLRVLETAGKSAPATLDWLGQRLALGVVPANSVATWRLRLRQGSWEAAQSSILEE